MESTNIWVGGYFDRLRATYSTSIQIWALVQAPLSIHFSVDVACHHALMVLMGDTHDTLKPSEPQRSKALKWENSGEQVKCLDPCTQLWEQESTSGPMASDPSGPVSSNDGHLGSEPTNIFSLLSPSLPYLWLLKKISKRYKYWLGRRIFCHKEVYKLFCYENQKTWRMWRV